MTPDPGISDVRPGDEVERTLGGAVKMRLKVTALTKDKIVCGAWEFDRRTGGEIDEDLGWDGYNTGSIIRRAPKDDKEG